MGLAWNEFIILFEGFNKSLHDRDVIRLSIQHKDETYLLPCQKR